MQLTRAADYAVRVMVHLAGLPPGTRASRNELAAAADCPEHFLSKVLQNLTHASLVISHRGHTGGFELTSASANASVLHVVEAIEGPIRLNLCLQDDDACNRRPSCPASAVWARAQDALTRVLSTESIAGLARQQSESPAAIKRPVDISRWH